MLKGHATLIVIDHIDSLLTKSGGWRDAKWGLLINALLERTAHTRLVLTSRREPTDLQQHPALRTLRIRRLRRRERALLARELPHLRPLFDDDAGRTLLRRTLSATQGHPQLLELADKMAAADRLAEQMADFTQHDALDALLETDDRQQSEEQLMNMWRKWSKSLQ